MTQGYSYSRSLFRAFGVELEYMIVDATSLDVRPVADEVIRCVAGAYVSDAEPDGPAGLISWSNELALHVIELKTNEPPSTLSGLAAVFQTHVRRINDLLAPMNARLMPTAMHPWMDPAREFRVWPHEYSAVYEAFNRIFNCRGHGWSNLQSVHLNLPFSNDEEFGRLHAAIRLLLPILPGLAASSPILDGRISGMRDTRLDVYRANAQRVPSVSGLVIPEPIYTRQEYEAKLLGGIYRDLAPHDPDGILRYEWVNARGCIARFDRGSIEVRVLDVQECPHADLAICALISELLFALTSERDASWADQQRADHSMLHEILLRCIREGEDARIHERAYLALFGLGSEERTAGEIWKEVARRTSLAESEWGDAIALILARGTLSTRIMGAVGVEPSRDRLRTVYRELCDCLSAGRMFMLDGV